MSKTLTVTSHLARTTADLVRLFASSRARLLAAPGLVLFLWAGITVGWTPAGALLVAVLVLLASVPALQWLINQPADDPRMLEIAAAIHQGVQAYMRRQYLLIASVGVIILALLLSFFPVSVSCGYVIGALFAAATAFVGLQIAVRANVRAVAAARSGAAPVFDLVFRSSSASGLLVVALGLAAVSGFYLSLKSLGVAHADYAMLGLAFGASSVSIYARLGGDLLLRAASVSQVNVATAVPEFITGDTRNVAAVTHSVALLISDAAGTVADLFESYLIALVASMMLGGVLLPGLDAAVVFPTMLAAVTLLGTWWICSQTDDSYTSGQPLSPRLLDQLLRVSVFSAVLFLPFSYLVFLSSAVQLDAAAVSVFSLYLCALAGLGLTVFIYAINSGLCPRLSGMRCGLLVQLRTTALPVLALIAGIWVAFLLAGTYGVAIMATALLSLAGGIVSLHVASPLLRNAKHIARMAGVSGEQYAVVATLNAKAHAALVATRSYAIAATSLAALVLFAVFLRNENLPLALALSDYRVVVGLLIGGLIPYLFGTLTRAAIERTASASAAEVQRQLRDIPGIMEYRAKPDYARSVDVLTRVVAREMQIPALLPVVVPLTTGYLLGIETLAGVLLGAIVVGLFVALSKTVDTVDTASSTVDAESTPAHPPAQALNIDNALSVEVRQGTYWVDPYSDKAGPAVNPLIKIVALISVLISVVI